MLARSARLGPLTQCTDEAIVAAPAPQYDDAVTLLHSLSGPRGIRASASSHANYAAVFARDAVMAGIAGLLIKDATITLGLRRTLEHLRDLQGPQGQIASNYVIGDESPPRVSFGTLVPRLDAALWFLIGVGLGVRTGALVAAEFRDAVHRVIDLLDGIEYNGRHLLYGPAGGNWADEYVYEGYVLHDQVLRAWGLRVAGDAFAEVAWQEKARQIERAILGAYWPGDDGDRTYPLAAVSPTRVYDVFDLASSALLGASGIAGGRAATTLDWIDETYLTRGALPPAFSPVIDEAHRDWPALARYHLHGFRNRPHEYHNGGVWMIWLGWLAVALARAHRHAALARLQHAVAAQLSASPEFAFDEYFHGRTGKPSGVSQMAYSATGMLFLRAASDPVCLTLLAP